VTGRAAAMVAGCDSWVRASHAGTAVEGLGGELTLTWAEPEPVDGPGGGCIARGLAVDRFCRVYRASADSVERLAVGPTATGLDHDALLEPVTIVGGSDVPNVSAADFHGSSEVGAGDLVGIAVDGDDRLFLADAATGAISVLDLWSRRLLRSVPVASPRRPSRLPGGLATVPGGDAVLAVVRRPAGLLRLSATRGPTEQPLPDAAADLPADAEPRRVAVLPNGNPVVLYADAAGDGWLVTDGRPPLEVGPASDVAVDLDGVVVLSPCPAAEGAVEGSGGLLRRSALVGDGWARVGPLDVAGYDGSGIVVLPGGRIGYFSPRGFRLGTLGRVSYAGDGHCITYRLDSGTPRNRWGRVLVEACIPTGTSCLVGAVTSDDEVPVALAHVPAEPAACEPAVPSATPPLPAPAMAATALERAGGLHERPGPVTPWWPVDGSYSTFEAPTHAPPGRYLWLTIRLRGDTRRTPRIREVRVEHQDHSLLRRLPAVYAAEPDTADFLRRYLGPIDGVLHDLELLSRCRDILVDPHATPAEALDWLSSFVGLVLDDRWALSARRQLLAEIVPLYRRRGTLASLSRYIELFLAGDDAGRSDRPPVSPVIIEHFRLRGAGGPIVGEEPAGSNRSVVGFGFRVGGAADDPDGTADLADDQAAFGGTAHRFSVLVPRPLGAEEEAAVRHILDTERPAHTSYELCTVDAGMRVGSGLHLGLSSIVGPTGAFEAAVTDRTLLGRRSILGGRATGVAVEAGRAGTARVG
jgi:phage tail-like protein